MSEKQEKISKVEIENYDLNCTEEETLPYDFDTQMDAREAEQDEILRLVGEINDGSR